MNKLIEINNTDKGRCEVSYCKFDMSNLGALAVDLLQPNRQFQNYTLCLPIQKM